MSLKVDCVCGRTLLVPDRRAGTRVACPKCGLRILVPLATDPVVLAVDRAEPPVIPVEERQISHHARAAETDPDVHETVVWLAAAFAVVAMIGMVPALFRFLDFVNQPNPPEIPRWVYVVSTAGLIQFALSIYLMQLPDWSSLWVATIGMLLVAAGYALFTGVTLSVSPANSLVEMFDLAAELSGRRAAGWCLAMLAQTGILAYLSGRVATRSRLRHAG